MNLELLKRHTWESVAAALILSLGLYVTFVVYEPIVGGAQINDEFTVSQTINDEIAFLVTAQDVTMSPSLSGITGGTSNGSTHVIVRTNAAAGYNITLNSSDAPAMQGNTSGDFIADHTYGTPTFDFDEDDVADTPGHAFGFTVEADDPDDLATDFRDNGSVCGGAGALDTADSCWRGASTTPITIVNRATATDNTGATTTLKFRVVLDANASDQTDQDTYVATTTLTATNNP